MFSKGGHKDLAYLTPDVQRCVACRCESGWIFLNDVLTTALTTTTQCMNGMCLELSLHTEKDGQIDGMVFKM